MAPHVALRRRRGVSALRLLRASCPIGAFVLIVQLAVPQLFGAMPTCGFAVSGAPGFSASRRHAALAVAETSARAHLTARRGVEEESEGPAPAPAPPLTEVRAGDRFTGWLKHPVLTRGEQFPLVIEVGPGDSEGVWSLQRPTAKEDAPPAFEGECKIEMGSLPGQVLLKDIDTLLNGTMNTPGPGSIAGRVAQCGLSWGGYFEAKLDIPEGSEEGGVWPFR